MEQTDGLSGKSWCSLAKIAGHQVALAMAKCILFTLVFFCAIELIRADLISIGTATTRTTQTGGLNDLRIDGEGFFVVRDPVTGVMAATRYGHFSLDADNFFITGNGARLQGFVGPGLTNYGDININSRFVVGQYYGSQIDSYSFQSDGMLRVVFDDGYTVMAGQVLLQQFTNPAALGTYLYKLKSINPAAGPLPAMQPPGSAGLGALAPGLEIPEPKLTLNRINGSIPTNAQACLTTTGVPSDMAIVGRGYFVVRDTNTSQLFATRAGTFLFDPAGYLINYAGHRLQGFSDSQFSERGDVSLKLPMDDNGAVCMQSYRVGLDGAIEVMMTDGTSYQAGQILLFDYTDLETFARTNFASIPLNSISNVLENLIVPNVSNMVCVLSGMIDSREVDDAIANACRTLNYFQPGRLRFTANPTDLAINGDGYFTLRNPTNDMRYATRDGEFYIDADGWLTHSSGFRLQGFSDANLSTIGDIRIDTQGAPTGVDPDAKLDRFIFSVDGKIFVVLSDGNFFVRGQVLLQKYRWSHGLQHSGGVLYSNLSAGIPRSSPSVPGDHGTGILTGGALEIPPPPVTHQVRPNAGLCLTVTGNQTPVTIEESTDLIHWTPVAEVPNLIVDGFEYFPTNSVSSPRGFYRIQSNE